MSKKKIAHAVSLFEQHEERLHSLKEDHDIYQWMRLVQDLTSRYIGPKSALMSGWDSLMRYGSKQLRTDSLRAIELCIIYIRDNGIYEPPSTTNNFLGALKDEVLVPVLVTLVGVCFGAGYTINAFRVSSLEIEILRAETKAVASQKKADSTVNKYYSNQSQVSKLLKEADSLRWVIASRDSTIHFLYLALPKR